MCFPTGSSCRGIWTAEFQRSEIWTCVLLVCEEPHGILHIHTQHFRTKMNSRFTQTATWCRPRSGPHVVHVDSLPDVGWTWADTMLSG